MTIAESIYKLRTKAKLSQEKLADILGVSRQAVHKLEAGTAQPDIGNIINLARYFNISLDDLLLDSNIRIKEEFGGHKKILPSYEKLPVWESYPEELETEYRQSMEEGLDVEKYKDLFLAVAKMERDRNKNKIGDVIFDIVLNAPARKDYKYNEPSDLEGIRALREKHEFEAKKPDKTQLKDKICGAWLGRVCGCMLGKTVEGIRTDELVPLLKESGNYPMHRYILSTDPTAEMLEKFRFPLSKANYIDKCDGMPADDDTNYTVMANLLIERYGRDFTPENVAELWLASQPSYAYCTAERVAFNNFASGYYPPDSAVYKNPYREWIGAQIRADYFGYINPGDPETAAEMAWRDASISHIKNGIYGEMFAAAMIACAAETDNIRDIILGGLGEIPATSRLYEQIKYIIEFYDSKKSCEACFDDIHSRYDEFNSHDWCHTISNAEIVVAALLYGEGDYGKSIGLAVQTGFDTDCNGATVGSILGMRGGTRCIDKAWSEPINDKLDTAIFGVGKVHISEMAKKTMKHIETK